MIMVHKTGGEVIGPAINQFLSGGSSSHYMIDRDGQIVKFVKDTIAAGHASHENNEDQSHWGSQTKLAYRSIGIENVGSDAQALTDAQYTSLIRLIQELMSAYNVPRHRVIGHGDCLTDGNAVLSDQRIECPGPLFEWDRLETANPPIGLARTGGTSSGADPVAAFFKTMTDKGVANLALTGGDFDPQPGAGKPSKFGHKDYKDITDTPIKTLQTWLAEIGYSVGTADGKLNPRTVQAARHFQVHFQNRDNVATINAETAALIKAVRDANPKAD
jgi:N-acetyl-anhydromuramyl-L-alanine amidase AmpD